ncbi:MAG: phospho-N-acetylmuramoyl-pentapeptide-transferase [Actinomycetota bacterium]|nr:phospho-N-acetylmuramoyl-pentapeptide-transferase [Actinomycetota bacterium]
MVRVLGAAFISGLICILATPALIRVLERLKFGQVIREDGPHAHFSKRGTPTMGGILIVAGTAAGYLIFSLHTRQGILVLLTMIACALLGFVDDLIQIMRRRSLGLKPAYKFLGQFVIAIGFAFFATQYCGLPSKLSFLEEFGFDFGWFFFIWVFIMVTATSNAVNLTDGLDGLASGSMIMVMAAYLLIAFTMFRHPITEHPKFYRFSGQPALDITIICGAVFGACVGFLWWNAAPAKIFMGDTGSLALGGVTAAVAIMTRTQLLLPILGGLFVVEALSVIIQVFVFKITGGKRVFKMAPIHHHFELMGWPEFTVMVRLWIFCGICVMLGFGIFYIDFVTRVPK